MTYRLTYTVSVEYFGPGTGQVSAGAGAQVKTLTQSAFVLVPGGETPTLANFNTAMTGSSSTPAAGSMANDLNSQISANLSQIQGFATGGN